MNGSAYPQQAAANTAWIAAIIASALVAGCAAALGGLPVLYLLIVVSLLVVFAAMVLRLPALLLGAAICALGLAPFPWGLRTGVLPKLFVDEVLLVAYLAVFPFLYFSSRRTWHTGFRNLYTMLAVFLFAESASLILFAHDLVALRNYIETFVLGALLTILAAQEAPAADHETLRRAIVWLTVIIAALSIVERIVERNPIMEKVTDVIYLSPTLAAITDGVYRPYVSFFHPSETGTFMGLGVPFALTGWLRRKSVWSSLALIVIAGGLFVNATRGVWAGVAIAALLLMPNPLLLLRAVVPATAAAATVAYVSLKDTPFMQRLTDPNNLLTRLESWKLAVKVFADHAMLGVGHMQFREVYLGYVQDLSNQAHFDLNQVYVVDNMYLTVLVEHGIIGLLGLLALFLWTWFALRKLRLHLLAAGRAAQSDFVHAAQLALVIYAVTGCFADINLFTKATKYLFLILGFGLAMSKAELPAAFKRSNDRAAKSPRVVAGPGWGPREANPVRMQN